MLSGAGALLNLLLIEGPKAFNIFDLVFDEFHMFSFKS